MLILDEGPMSILAKKVADKSLMPDEHQKQVVADLQKLYEQVKTYEPRSSSGVGSWFSFGKKTNSDGNEIKGLYIYGSVGGGKTMLMDMFFDCCKVFNLEIYSKIRFLLDIFLDFKEEARSFQFIHDWRA